YAGFDQLNKDGFSYDVSLTAANTQFYDTTDNETEDRGEPHLAMEFEKQLLDNMAGRVGTVSSTAGDSRKQYFTTGLTAGVAEALIGLDTAYDIDGAYQTAASARRQFGDLSVGATAGYTSEGFAAEDEDDAGPGSYDLGLSTRLPIGKLFDRPVIYSTDHDYSLIEGGGSRLKNEMGLSGYLKRLNVSQNILRTLEEDNLGTKTEKIEGNTNLSTSLLGTRWRFSTNYDFAPESQIDSYRLDITKPIRKNLRTNLKLEHEPLESLSTGTASVTYSGQQASLTPSVT
ncbi:MAG TPA: hypothetical protein PLO23_10765, partial [Alphaproteobacteria bacterium]|nr:hypothetical protein [Alphaproteobacteria bacterium]